MKKRDYIYLIFALVALVFILRKYTVPPVIVTETITVIDSLTTTDTIVITEYKYITKEVVRWESLAVNDSTKKDSIPITKTVVKDSLFEVSFEGFRARLLGVKVFPKTITIYTEKLRTTTIHPPRVTHGIQIGVGGVYGVKNGADFGAYIGYGLNIRLNKNK